MQNKNRLDLVRRRFAFLALAGCAPFLLAACRFGESDRSDEGTHVVMELIDFRPEFLEVASGTTVTWTNKDSAAHTVTSGAVEQGAGVVTERPDGKFGSGEIARGRTFPFTFEDVGTQSYFCSFHPATMRGEVRVR